MKPGRAPNYCLTEDYCGLPAGAFLRPVEWHYVPQETLERLGVDKYVDVKVQIICYTAKGMMLVPRDKLKEG